MCSCHSILECCVMFPGVKLSMGLFVLFRLNINHMNIYWIYNIEMASHYHGQTQASGSVKFDYDNVTSSLCCKSNGLFHFISIQGDRCKFAGLP